MRPGPARLGGCAEPLTNLVGCRATLYSQIVIPHPSLFVDAISRRSRPFRPPFARSSLRISRAPELQSERPHDRVLSAEDLSSPRSAQTHAT